MVPGCIYCISYVNFLLSWIYLFYSNVNMKFRNYLPHDKQLQEGKLAPPVLPKFEDPVATEPPEQDDKEVSRQSKNLLHLIHYLHLYILVSYR